MTLTLEPILRSAGIDPAESQVIRHTFVREHDDTGLQGIRADSTDAQILAYTGQQSATQRVFPPVPPPIWVVFVREGAIELDSGRWSRTAVRYRTTAGAARSTWSSPSI